MTKKSLQPKNKKTSKTKGIKTEMQTISFDRKTILWMSLALVVVTFVCYIPTLKNDFVDYDDKKFIYGNPVIQGLNGEKFVEIFEYQYKSPWYKPMVYLTWAIEYHFFGLNPKAYHLTNIIIHLINTVLVFLILTRIIAYLYTKSRYRYWISAAVALLFSLSPLRVESVAWAVERKDVLFSLFFLGSMLSYLNYTVKGGYYRIIIGCLLFTIGIISKSMIITLPFVLFVIDYLFKRKLHYKLFLEKIPYFIVLIVGLYWLGVFNPENSADFTAAQSSIKNAISNNSEDNFTVFGLAVHKATFTSYRMVNWLSRIVAPQKLVVIYPLPDFYFEKL